MPDTLLILSLVGGLVILAFAGDSLVGGAVSLSRRFGISPLIAGIFIVGFGTSAPEMIVALDAARSGYPELALGNIVGSNIANILLVLSLPAIIATIHTGGRGQSIAAGAMTLSTGGWMVALATTGLIAGIGTVFFLGLAIYALVAFVSMRGEVPDVEIQPQHGFITSLGLVIMGFVGLPVGAHLIVEGGVGIARTYNISEEIIGLTLLAVGTSLPEIGAGIAAALRARADVLVGNVLGSNIFNILGAGGIVSFFGPISAAPTFLNYDHWVLAASALFLSLIILIRAEISRLAGIAMLLFYVIYIIGLVSGWNLSALVGMGHDAA